MSALERLRAKLKKEKKPAFQIQAESDSNFFHDSVKRTLLLYKRAVQPIKDGGHIEIGAFEEASIAAFLAELDAKHRIIHLRVSPEEKNRLNSMMESLSRAICVNMRVVLSPQESERLKDPLNLQDYELRAQQSAQIIFNERSTEKTLLERRMKLMLTPHLVMMKYHRTGRT